MKVRYYGNLRVCAGEPEVDLDKPIDTLEALLGELSERYGEAFRRQVFEGFQIADGLTILINGKNARQYGGLMATLDRDDTVHLLSPIAGG
jgi:MoaD family protein